MAARMLAVYGKGGMGKSFFTANLVATMARANNRVLQLGCDPKHDSCNTVFDGTALPTIGDTWRAFKDGGKEEQMTVSNLVYRTQLAGTGETVYGAELGGPDVGRGCGGRGITFGFDLLEKMGMSKWALDYIVMDFLGDVVCGGFATPFARSLAEEVILIAGHDRQSLYAANNIARAADYFMGMGGRTRILGLVVNRDDGSGLAERFAAAIGIPVLMKIPYSTAARERSDACKLIIDEPEFRDAFAGLAHNIATRRAIPVENLHPLDYEEFLNLFGAFEKHVAPPGASEDDLFGLSDSGVIPLTGDQMVIDRSRFIIERLLTDMGADVIHVEDDAADGITVTTKQGWKAVFGDTRELDAKLSFLAALNHFGEPFTYVDVRETSAPSYR